jgi:hypothetical protein
LIPSRTEYDAESFTGDELAELLARFI